MSFPNDPFGEEEYNPYMGMEGKCHHMVFYGKSLK